MIACPPLPTLHSTCSIIIPSPGSISLPDLKEPPPQARHQRHRSSPPVNVTQSTPGRSLPNPPQAHRFNRHRDRPFPLRTVLPPTFSPRSWPPWHSFPSQCATLCVLHPPHPSLLVLRVWPSQHQRYIKRVPHPSLLRLSHSVPQATFPTLIRSFLRPSESPQSHLRSTAAAFHLPLPSPPFLPQASSLLQAPAGSEPPPRLFSLPLVAPGCPEVQQRDYQDEQPVTRHGGGCNSGFSERRRHHHDDDQGHNIPYQNTSPWQRVLLHIPLRLVLPSSPPAAVSGTQAATEPA